MVYNIQNYWVFGLGPSSRIPKIKADVSETESVSVLRRGDERRLLCWVPYKELTTVGPVTEVSSLYHTQENRCPPLT
jgi:hypothetical protein